MPDRFESYIDAAVRSTARARLVLIVVVTSSALALGAWWNSVPFSWINSRVSVSRVQLKASGCEPKSVELSQEEKELLERSTRYVELRKALSCDLLRDWAQNLERVRIEQVMLIKVPFFGISIDVNDLGIIAGFTFVVILIWFRFSLSRELTNLRVVFRQGRDHDELKAYYDVLAMEQVMTVPHMREETRRGLWWWIPKALFFFPAAIEFIIMLNDARTWKIGLALNLEHTMLLYALGFVFFVLIMALTLNCVSLSRQVDREWGVTAAELGIPPETARA